MNRFDAIVDEVEKARIKYPASDLSSRYDGFVQECGEALQAIVKYKQGIGTLEHARLEVIQAAGQAIRLLEEAL